MAGEIWREVVQIGKETVFGTPVAATRKAYTRDPSITIDAASRPHEFATGTRDRVRGHNVGPEEIGGQVMLPMSADEILEWLLITVQGGVTPTTPAGATNARRWAFKVAGTTLDSLTLQRMDGAQAYRTAGVRGNTLAIAGSSTEANELTIGLMGQSVYPGPDDTDFTLTTGLSDRVPTFYEGWETTFGVGDFGDDPEAGITYIDGTLINWNISLNNNIERKYHGQNTKNSTGLAIGSPAITAQVMLEAASPDTWAEFKKWRKNQLRILRLVFGNNQEIEAGFNKYVSVDLPGAWTAVDLGQNDRGTRTYQFNMTYVTDPALGSGLQIVCQNARTAVFN